MLNKREKVISYFTGAVVFGSLFLNFIVFPLVAENNRLTKEITVSRMRLFRYQQLIKQKDRIQEQYSQFVTDKSPGKQEQALSILSELERLAKSAQIQVIDVRPQTPTETSVVKEKLVDLRTEGTMESYIRFIYELEDSVFLFKIQRFQLTARPSSSVLEGTFSIVHISGDNS